MTAQLSKTTAPRGSTAALEERFIDEYLCGLGYSPHCMRELLPGPVNEVLTAASEYASDRLAEIKALARLVKHTPGVAPAR